MEKIILRPVAITDLNIRYARHMGGNKVRHYTLPALVAYRESLSRDDMGKSFVRRFIEETEGITDIEFADAPQAGQRNESGVLYAEDVTNLVFTRPHDKPTLRALKKQAVKTLVVQYNWYKSAFDKLYDRFVVNPWNALVYRFGLWRAGFRALDYKFDRKLHLVRFLTISCEFDELPEAFEALRRDLIMLNDFGLIEGHLAMPSVMQLADTVGLGKKPVVLFCFPVINERRAQELLNKQPFELPNQYLELFNVVYETGEGSISPLNGIDFEKKYEIEVVQVGGEVFNGPSITSDEARQAYIDSFEASKDWVNEVSSTQKEQLKKLEKESHSSTMFEQYIDEDGNLQTGRAVAVNVNVKLKRKE